MARIPDQTISQKVKTRMQSQTQLDDPQVGSKVGLPLREQIAECVANFLSQLDQSLIVQVQQLLWRIKSRENLVH